MTSDADFDFDFDRYLATLDPTTSYTIHPVSGGLVNITRRAVVTKSQNKPVKGRFGERESVILKFAPPYIAALGPSAPFSVERQDVEACATELFGKGGVLEGVRRRAGVDVPEVVYHDREKHILVLEDLGHWATLRTYLEGGNAVELGEGEIKEIGRRIGRFFAELHSARSLELVRSCVSIGALKNEAARDLILPYAVRSIQGYLADYRIPNAEALYSRVVAAFTHRLEPDELCFALGDFTPGSILVSSTDKELRVGVIDWEFASDQVFKGQDMAQFLAHLQLMLLDASRESAAYKGTEMFVRVVCKACYEGDRVPIWHDEFGQLGDTEGSQLEPGTASSSSVLIPTSLRSRMLRSALILHGREIINNAIECEWEGNLKNNADMGVRLGAWYLERAGASVEDMLTDGNLEELGREESRVISNLFGL